MQIKRKEFAKKFTFNLQVIMNERFKVAVLYLIDRHEVKNQADIARRLGKDSATMSLYLKGKRGIPLGTIDDLCLQFANINKTWLLTGEGEMVAKSSPFQSIIANANGHAVQHNNLNIGHTTQRKEIEDVRQVAILTPEIAKEPDVDIMGLVERNELETRAALPSLPKYDICYRNQANCMAPWIMPGDQLALQYISSDTPIFGGEVYAIDYKQTGLLIRRVYEEEGGMLRLVAFNQDYSPVVIRKDDVYSFFRIVGQLRTFSSGRMI